VFTLFLDRRRLQHPETAEKYTSLTIAGTDCMQKQAGYLSCLSLSGTRQVLPAAEDFDNALRRR
jgi:hypothetical protein